MILQTEELSFSYGSADALCGVSLSLDAGQVLCVMGPNGSGKSTLIDTIMGIHRPRQGRVLLCDRPLTEYRRYEIARRAAYVPQAHTATFPYTVLEVVLMGRTAYAGAFRVPGAENRAVAMEALERVGIADLARRPYIGLSGGELRLVLLARALSQQAPLILMDEPTAHLDYRNEMRFLETVCQLCRQDGIAVLIATHSPEHAFYFESSAVPVRALFLQRGRVAVQGPPTAAITEEVLSAVYGVQAKILESGGEKTILLQRSLPEKEDVP